MSRLQSAVLYFTALVSTVTLALVVSLKIEACPKPPGHPVPAAQEHEGSTGNVAAVDASSGTTGP